MIIIYADGETYPADESVIYIPHFAREEGEQNEQQSKNDSTTISQHEQ